MAITKKVKVYQFETDNYVKPTSVIINEAEQWEWYDVSAIVDFYTDSTKEFKYDTKQYIFKNLKESELWLPSIYGKLMWLEEFIWYKLS